MTPPKATVLNHQATLRRFRLAVCRYLTVGMIAGLGFAYHHVWTRMDDLRDEQELSQLHEMIEWQDKMAAKFEAP